MPDVQGPGGAGGGAKAKQSAVETLLGEHSALVNLDSLVQPRRGQQVTTLHHTSRPCLTMFEVGDRCLNELQQATDNYLRILHAQYNIFLQTWSNIACMSSAASAVADCRPVM